MSDKDIQASWLTAIVNKECAMVVRDYSKRIEAMMVDEEPTSELPARKDLRAQKSPPSCLTFTKEAAALRTHFRDYVLQTIFEVAKSEVGNALKTADVIVERDYDEPEVPRLALCLWADIDVAQWRRADDAIIEAISEEKLHWFELEKEEYIKTIGYDLLVLNV